MLQQLLQIGGMVWQYIQTTAPGFIEKLIIALLVKYLERKYTEWVNNRQKGKKA